MPDGQATTSTSETQPRAPLTRRLEAWRGERARLEVALASEPPEARRAAVRTLRAARFPDPTDRARAEEADFQDQRHAAQESMGAVQAALRARAAGAPTARTERLSVADARLALAGGTENHALLLLAVDPRALGEGDAEAVRATRARASVSPTCRCAETTYPHPPHPPGRTRPFLLGEVEVPRGRGGSPNICQLAADLGLSRQLLYRFRGAARKAGFALEAGW
jgi:hypothetical protein